MGKRNKVNCLRCGRTWAEDSCTRVAGTENQYICKFCKLRMEIVASDYKKRPEVTGHWQLVVGAVFLVGGFALVRFSGEAREIFIISCLTIAMVFLIMFSSRKKQGEMIFRDELLHRGQEIYTPTFFSNGTEFCLNCGRDVKAEDEACPYCGAIFDREQNEERREGK